MPLGSPERGKCLCINKIDQMSRWSYLPLTSPCPAITVSGDDFDLVVGTFTSGEATRLVLANDDYEHPAAFRVSAASDRRIRKAIASWNAKLPADLNTPAEEWSLGPAGCVLIELAQ